MLFFDGHAAHPRCGCPVIMADLPCHCDILTPPVDLFGALPPATIVVSSGASARIVGSHRLPNSFPAFPMRLGVEACAFSSGLDAQTELANSGLVIKGPRGEATRSTDRAR
jgi:hypothetical protein